MNGRIHMALLCLILSLSSFAQNYKIDIKISNADTMMLMILGESDRDTFYTNNGQFSHTGTLSSPEMIRLILIKDSQSIEAAKAGNERGIRSKVDVFFQDVLAEGGLISFKGPFPEMNRSKFQLENAVAQKKYEDFRQRFNPLVQMARVIIDSSYTFDTSVAAKKTFQMLLRQVVHIENEVAKNFAAQNTDNPAGAYVLYRYANINDPKLLDSMYNLFDAVQQQSIYLKKVKEKINNLSVLKPGMPSPDFKFISHTNDSISLKKFKGKFIVLDFWGSWCPPCIKGFDAMRSYYTKYKHQVEFIGIACQDTDEDWKKAIKKHKLSWSQIFNGNGTNDLTKIYNIQAFPTKVIIDGQGNFLYSFVGETDSFYQQLDLLLDQKNSTGK
ncbi:TlpA family protein disulfide reductase [Gynurincola endophyticus]|uniref:TlpA family protein disulfide reductase n=1 Tax=Gynurincola endophyticus TaxID=2479004 RepID=UPI000F8F2D35|nr:TlpA disulfide reductase family protein [Gynurincola endophyticus]